jgi:hypothetical protein
VEQTLAEHLPNSRKDFGGEHVFPDKRLLLAVELLDPPDVFISANHEETDGP